MADLRLVAAGTPGAAPAYCVHFVGPLGHKPALRIEVNRQGCQRVAGLDKTEAEELLDWLENQGVRGCKVTYVGGEGFSVWYS